MSRFQFILEVSQLHRDSISSVKLCFIGQVMPHCRDLPSPFSYHLVAPVLPYSSSATFSFIRFHLNVQVLRHCSDLTSSSRLQCDALLLIVYLIVSILPRYVHQTDLISFPSCYVIVKVSSLLQSFATSFSIYLIV